MAKATFRINAKSVLLTWLLSYSAVLLLPVTMSVIVYMQSSRTLEREIHQANDAMLEQFREAMDNQFENMKRLNFELTWNVKVRQLLYSNKYLHYPNEFYYDLHQVTQELNMYRTSFSTIDLFYIYQAKNGLILLPDVYREARFGYNLLHHNEVYSYEQWQTMVSNTPKGFIPSMRMTENGFARKTVAYVSPYSSDNGLPVATNIVMIDQSRILSGIEHIELFNKGHVVVLNENNDVLVSSSDDVPLSGFPFATMQGTGTAIWRHDGQRYEVSYISSSSTGLKYVSIVPSRVYWEKAQRVRGFTYVSIAISMLGGAGLTYFFLRRNYYPVRRIVQALKKKPAAAERESFNEFHFIQEELVSTLDEMDRLRRSVKQQHQIVRNHFISRLLKGRLDGQTPVDESLAAFGMRFDTDDFAVMLLVVDNGKTFLERFGDDDRSEKLLQFIVTNVAEEMVARRHRGYVAETDESLACLINFSAEEPQMRLEDLQTIAAEVQRFLADKYHIRLTISISGIHSSIGGIPQAYTEALDALEYKLVMGGRDILRYDDLQRLVPERPECGYYFPLDVEQRLINCVKAGDFDKAKETIDEVIERNVQPPVPSLAVVRCMLFDLVAALIKSVDETGGLPDRVLFDLPKRLDRLTGSETIQEMRQQMAELLRNVCDYTESKRRQNIEQTRAKAMRQLVEKVSDYIAGHFRDPNLNISMIGAHFDLKPAYLSRLYKDHTGEGLLDRINRERIGEAKRLIADGGKSVSEIAGHVGYNDVNAFIRVFKKYEGITPGAYKESLTPKPE